VTVLPSRDRLLLGVAALGLVLRTRAFLFNRSLWDDELMLALGVVDRGLGELLLEPLAFGQSAPPGFLVLVWALTRLTGTADWALRLVPFLAGVVLLWASVALAEMALRARVARLGLVGIVALSPLLIYYASEFKPYGMDAAATVVILVAALGRHRDGGMRRLALVGGLAALVSLPAILVLAAVGLVLLVDQRRSELRRPRDLFLVVIGWGVGVLVHAGYALRHAGTRSNMVGWWSAREAFLPLPPTSAADLRWYARAANELTFLTFVERTKAEPGVFVEVAQSPLQLTVVAGAVVLLALSVLAGTLARHRALAVPVITFAIALLASGLRVYPLSSRLSVYLVPMVALVLAVGVDVLAGSDRTSARAAGGRVGARVGARGVVAAAVAGLLVVTAGVSAARNALDPPNHEDAKGAFAIVAGEHRPTDLVVLEYGSRKAHAFYGEEHLAGIPVELVDWREDGGSRILELGRERDAERVWLVMTDRANRAEVLIDVIGPVLVSDLSWSATNTRVERFIVPLRGWDVIAIPERSEAASEPAS
jgi:hypothetical protein